jgi:hypothetical protein
MKKNGLQVYRVDEVVKSLFIKPFASLTLTCISL